MNIHLCSLNKNTTVSKDAKQKERLLSDLEIGR